MTYFGKDVSELSLVECAALASLPKSPTKYDPIRNPENNLTRRRTVLKLMYEQECITWEQYRDAYAVEELTFAEDDKEYTETIHSYYIDAVIDEVIADLMAKKGYSKEIASAYLYSGGLKIVTCMDPFVQESMESVYENFTFDGEEDTIIPQSAMVVMDPDTGDVLGIVGGRGEKKESRGLNRATQSTRQCGSSIKPLSVYSLALENGFITYGAVIDDTPLVTEKKDPEDPTTSNKTWPVNSPAGYRGLTTINYAVYRSLNTVSAKLVTEMTPQRSFDFLTQKLHFSTLVKSYTSSAGTYYTDIAVSPMAHGAMTFGVTVRDMCAGYTVLANEGTYSAPRLYSVITDSSGTIVLEQQEEHENVLKISTAYIMTKMLENVVTQPSGTGYKLTLNKKSHFPTLQVAGKTGTTAEDRDRYFCGYTPYYVGATWFGYDNNKVLSKYTSNPAMQLWDQVMILLHERIYEEEGGVFETFDVPGDVIEVTYCKDSGMLLSDSCALDLRGDRSETGYFLIGTEPTEECDKHIVVKWDSVTQAVACDYCPQENLVDIALVLNESRDFALQVYVTDAQYMYRPVDATTVMPEAYSSDEYPNTLPFFYSTVGIDRYCGITRIKDGHAVNCYCWEHAALAPETSEDESVNESTDVSVDESTDESAQESTVSIPNPWA
ncbi:MAG TPA: penicillin-binding transpeptidase domain-containing protein, partial [Bacillota bacterium]|nr:penicillin-binding transpeptidase domain-containing protein [Bacillota bacterium]